MNIHEGMLYSLRPKCPCFIVYHTAVRSSHSGYGDDLTRSGYGKGGEVVFFGEKWFLFPSWDFFPVFPFDRASPRFFLHVTKPGL